MKTNNGISKIDLIIVLVVFAVLPAITVPVLHLLSRRGSSVVCGTNLKGLGTAFIVYAHDYDGRYPQLPGTGPWSKELGFPYDLPRPDFSPDGAQNTTPRSVSASWYLLVREVDVSPKSLVCPHSTQSEFDGRNPYNWDLVQLWDFGPSPHAHVSYAMHNPYGRFPADDFRSAAFVVAADMSLWFNDGNILPPGSADTPPQVMTLADPATWPLGNTLNHPKLSANTQDGQNVLFADGHVSYETKPNIGVNNDNIYTFWSTDDNPTDQDKQGAAAPTGRTSDNDAKSQEDSFLVI